MTPNDEKDDSPKPVAIGIDFGTSKCCVAAVRDGRVHVLENEFGQRTTPSWVAFNSQQRLVGAAALDQAVVNCANTVSAVKMTLGKTYDKVKDLPSARKIQKRYHNNSPQYCVNYKKRRECLSPEQIAAMLLTKMKVMAETSLGCSVDKAVISVPACYGNAQRAALMNAAKVAGLDVQQLINETTAAGIAFEDNRRVKTPTTIAVVDFGAGKLDLSIMEVEEKSITVIAATGSPSHGGCNLDDFLVKHSVPYIQQKYGKDVNISDKAHVKLRLACEKAKKTLSLLTEAQICTDSLIDDRDVKIPVRRQDISIFLEETKKTIVGNFERLFKGKSIRKDTIDRVVLVGGSTRIPAIMSILEEYFGPHKLDQTVNQDEAVAQGAALRAAALSGAVAGIEVSDVSSYDVYSSMSRNVIGRNSRLPYSVSFNFSVQCDSVRFFERNKCTEQKIGALEFFRWRFEFFTGYRCIIIWLIVDTDGIFNVYIDRQYLWNEDIRYVFPFYNQYCIKEWTKTEKHFQLDAQKELKRVEAEVELESLIFEVQSAMQDPEILKYSRSREVERLQKTCSAAQNCMDKIESFCEHGIKPQIRDMREAKVKAERLKIAAHKQASEEKAAKEKAELEVEIARQKSKLESFYFELQNDLKDQELRQYSSSQEVEVCDKKLGWLNTSELTSLENISEKFEHLNCVKSEIEKLKESSRRNALKEKEEVLVNGMELRAQVTSCLSLVKSFCDELRGSEKQHPENSELVEIYKQKMKSLEATLYDMFSWMHSDDASLSKILSKIEEVKSIKAHVEECQVTLRSAQMEISETDDGVSIISEQSSPCVDLQTDRGRHSDCRISDTEDKCRLSSSPNPGAGRPSRSLDRRNRSSSRSCSRGMKENANSYRSRSPLLKPIDRTEAQHSTPTFNPLDDKERQLISTCLSGNAVVVCELINITCQSPKGIAADCSESLSSSTREYVPHSSSSLVENNTQNETSRFMKNSPSSNPVSNDDACALDSGTFSMACVSWLRNPVHGDSNETTSQRVLEFEESSPENDSTPLDNAAASSAATSACPSSADGRALVPAPDDFEEGTPELVNGANNASETPEKNLNMFDKCAELQYWIKREISECKTCASSGRVCYRTRTHLLKPLNELIDDIGTEMLKTTSKNGNESTQRTTVTTQISVSEVIETVKKSANLSSNRLKHFSGEKTKEKEL